MNLDFFLLRAFVPVLDCLEYQDELHVQSEAARTHNDPAGVLYVEGSRLHKIIKKLINH